MIPLPPFDTATLAVMLVGNPIVVFALSFFAGMLAGKQEHDNAAITSPDGSVVVTDWTRRNVTVFDWITDGMYGFFGAFVAFGMIDMGVMVIPITLLPIAGYAGRKLVLKAAEKF
jgi:hypothetical protein